MNIQKMKGFSFLEFMIVWSLLILMIVICVVMSHKDEPESTKKVSPEQAEVLEPNANPYNKTE